MGMKWDENSIREVFRSLDEITGLSGAKLPIVFGNARGTLGFFSAKDDGLFRFSRYWFENEDWPIESALDVIRHEYAHYMDWMIYHNLSHGKTWKKCCLEVGAVPTRLYISGRSEYYKAKHQKEEEQLSKLNEYKKGQKIIHPKYGSGIIEELRNNGNAVIAHILFKNIGVKIVDLNWIDKNCKKILEEKEKSIVLDYCL